MILRDAARLHDCAARLNYCPLGSGAVAGATLALDRSIAASELGFTAPTGEFHGRNQRSRFHPRISAGAHLCRVCISAVLPRRSRFSPRRSSVLSCCPKHFLPARARCRRRRILISTELLRAKVGRIHAAAAAVTMQLKGLPLAYNKDMQETQEPAFAVEFVAPMLALVARFTTALRFNRERMNAAASLGLFECHGRRHLSGSQGSSLPQGA